LPPRGKGRTTPSPAVARPPRTTTVDPLFLEDLRFWVDTERKTALRLLDLVEAARRDPFDGLGKPEPLKYPGAGVWSRRLTGEHRFVYRVTEERIDCLQVRYHY
jgi:toxin YoeB